MAIAVSAAAFLLIVIVWGLSRRIESGGKPWPPGPLGPGPEDLSGNIHARLCKADWSPDAAEKVVGLNAEWFKVIKSDDPAAYEFQVKFLEDLGKYPVLGGFLEEYPETAGLLAGSNDPVAVAATLKDAHHDYPILAGLYVRYADREDVAALAQALKKNRELICRLIRRGLPGAEVLFLLDDRDEGDKIYATFLKEVFESKLTQSDEDLASLYQFLLNQGPAILEKLKRDKGFRAEFAPRLWPKLERVASGQQGAFELYLDDPRIWDLLELPYGETLLAKYSKLPLPLLFGEHAVPKELHEQVLQAFLQENRLAIEAMVEFHAQPLFHSLLKRSLTLETRGAAFKELLKLEGGAAARLQDYARWSDSALAEEVDSPPAGPITWAPGYPTYLVAKKLYQGRDVTLLEWFEAAAEMVPSPAGKGGKVFTTTLKNVGFKLIERRIGREAAKQIARAERELVKWTITAKLAQLQANSRRAFTHWAAIDVTRPVQFVFSYSKLGRSTFHRLTGLEARLFMRKDGRVYIRLDRVAMHLAKEYLNEFAETMMESVQPDDDGPEDVAELVVPAPAALPKVPRKSLPPESELLQSWKRHVAAWWLLNLNKVGKNPG